MSKKKKVSPIRYVAILIMLGVSAFCVQIIYTEITTTLNLNTQISEATKVKQDLNAEKETLNQLKSNLSNPDYVVRYARGRYMVTKEDGEQVFKLPSE